jgi:hypothetical protein
MYNILFSFLTLIPVFPFCSSASFLLLRFPLKEQKRKTQNFSHRPFRYPINVNDISKQFVSVFILGKQWCAVIKYRAPQGPYVTLLTCGPVKTCTLCLCVTYESVISGFWMRGRRDCYNRNEIVTNNRTSVFFTAPVVLSHSFQNVISVFFGEWRGFFFFVILWSYRRYIPQIQCTL